MTSSRTILDTIGTLTLAGLIVVSGLLARENIQLKEMLAAAGREEGGSGIDAGDRLGPLTLLTHSGDRRVLFSGPDTNALLLLVLDTSCPHCENTIPVWNQFAVVWPDRGLEVLGISLDDTGRTREYLDRHDVRFPVASILDEAYLRMHGIQGVPATILIGGGARVVRAWPGEITPEAFQEIADAAGSLSVR